MTLPAESGGGGSFCGGSLAHLLVSLGLTDGYSDGLDPSLVWGRYTHFESLITTCPGVATLAPKSSPVVPDGLVSRSPASLRDGRIPEY